MGLQHNSQSFIKIFSLIIALGTQFSTMGQKLEINIKESPRYYVNDTLHVEVYLINTDTVDLQYFDALGPSWESFVEKWDLNVNHRLNEVYSTNSYFEDKFPDSTIRTLNGLDTSLLRTKEFYLIEAGDYNLIYNIQQGPKLVKQAFADSDSTYQHAQKIATFDLSQRISFDVYPAYDTIFHDTANMSWENWKDYRHVKLYSRKQHFDNMYAALKYPNDVYALTLICNGETEENIKKIGTLKNLRALKLIQYNLDYFPKEIVDLDLYELTLLPKEDLRVSFPHGISSNQSLRELKLVIKGDFPADILLQKELTHLDLSKSAINLIPNLSPLQNLEFFSAANAHLKTLDFKLESLPKLKEVELSGNRELKDMSPLFSCTALEFITMNRTSVPEIPDDIANLKKLKRLTISSEITQVSDSIGALSDLRYLSFSGNRQLTSLSDSVIKLQKLIHLDLSRSGIKTLPEGISELPLEKVMLLHTDMENTKDYKILRKQLGDNFKE